MPDMAAVRVPAVSSVADAGINAEIRAARLSPAAPSGRMRSMRSRTPDPTERDLGRRDIREEHVPEPSPRGLVRGSDQPGHREADGCAGHTNEQGVQLCQAGCARSLVQQQDRARQREHP